MGVTLAYGDESVDKLVNYNLDRENPSKKEEVIELEPDKLIDNILKNEQEIQKALKFLDNLIKGMKN